MPDGTNLRNMPLQKREVQFVPGTFNEENLTVDVIWTTGAGVRRFDWYSERYYMEELVVSENACSLARLNNGAPVCNAHGTYDLSQQIGVVERASIKGGEGLATLRLSRREDTAGIVQDIRDGIIRNISVGYRVDKWEIIRGKTKDDLDIYRAVAWEPHEISFVPVGADAGAGVRGQPQTFPCEFTESPTQQSEHKERTMPDNNQQTPAAAQQPAVNEAEVTRQATQRSLDILQAARSLGLEGDAEALIRDANLTTDQARAKLIEKHAEKNKADATAIQPTVRTQQSDRPSGDDPAVKQRAMSDAIAARFSDKVKPTDHAREYMGFSLVEIAAECIRMSGQKLESRHPARIIDQAMKLASRNMHSTSDFAILLADSTNKMLLPEYQQAEPTYRKIAARQDFKDFKQATAVNLGDFPALLQVGESGEIKAGTMSNSKEVLALATYARRLIITRAALINDDLSGFARLTMKAGRRVADFENATFFALLAQNSGAGPTLVDTNAMFHTVHNNIAAVASAIDVANLGKAKAQMRKQTSLDGLKLNLAPRYLLTGPDKEVEAQQITSPINAALVGSVNPFSGKLETITDANVAGNKWYLFADPNQAEAFIYGYLEGDAGPRVETRPGFEQEGIDLKVAIDFGAGAVDYRPAVYNAGA